MMTPKPTPEQIKASRIIADMTERQEIVSYLAARDGRLLAENADLKERVAWLVVALRRMRWPSPDEHRNPCDMDDCRICATDAILAQYQEESK